MIDDTAAVVRHIKNNLINLDTANLPDEYYYQSLPLCVIDAVFSIGVRYESTRNTVRRWCQSQLPPWSMICHIPASEGRRSEYTIEDFLIRVNGKDCEALAQTVFRNRQRTSSRGGILKAEAVLKFAAALTRCGINDFDDTRDNKKTGQARSRVLRIEGQGSGISFDYFQMLSGSDQHVKVDRMVRRFVADALGRSEIPADSAQTLVLEACQRIQVEFPHLTPRLLDYEIWNYQRSRNVAGRNSLLPVG